MTNINLNEKYYPKYYLISRGIRINDNRKTMITCQGTTLNKCLLIDSQLSFRYVIYYSMYVIDIKVTPFLTVLCQKITKSRMCISLHSKRIRSLKCHPICL